MIDKARIERIPIQAITTSAGTTSELTLTVVVKSELDALETDYLALRAVVEALADLNPTIGYIRHGIGDCPLCGVAVPHHLGSCPVKMAVALVGSAGGARTEAEA